jgi:hypothetical protein
VSAKSFINDYWRLLVDLKSVPIKVIVFLINEVFLINSNHSGDSINYKKLWGIVIGYWLGRQEGFK